MPEFIAVQCFKCSQYQVSQRRKDSKFNCKLCSAKQSVRKVFGHSDRAADVRKFVQQLNLARGRAEEQFEQLNADTPAEQPHDNANPNDSSKFLGAVQPDRVSSARSRWQPYSTVVTKDSGTSYPDEEECDAEDDLVTALPDMQGKGRGRKRKRAARQRQGQREKLDRGNQWGAVPARKNQVLSEHHNPSLHVAQDPYQWGAPPIRKNLTENDAPSRDATQKPSQKPYQWGSAMSRMDQSSPGSITPPYNQHSRWGAPPPRGPHAHPENRRNPSPAVTTAIDSDGLLTTFGADEVVQDEVLY